MKFCRTCGRPRHSGLCDMATLSDGRVVHVSRIDRYDGDVRQEVEQGKVKVANRWIKKVERKTRARRS
jgi:hypothetical protein